MILSINIYDKTLVCLETTNIRTVTSYLDYLRDCEEYLSKEKVDGCVVIKSTF